MIENPTKDIERLKVIKGQMLSVVMYSEAWFKLKEKWKKLFNKIEEKRRDK